MIAKSLQKSCVDTAQVLQDMYTTMRDFKQIHTHRFTALYKKKQEIEKKVLTMLLAYNNKKDLEHSLKDEQEKVDAARKTKKLTEDFEFVT